MQLIWVSTRSYKNPNLVAAYLYVVPWSGFFIVPSYPHYPHLRRPVGGVSSVSTPRDTTACGVGLRVGGGLGINPTP